MTRALHFLGAALVWTLILAACAVGLAVCGPLFLVVETCRGVWVVGRILAGRAVDVPDEATPALARRIDGADLDDVLARRRMGCGCWRTPDGPTAHCVGCGWVTCVGHAGATHLCERDPIRSWQDASLTAAVEAGVNDAFARIAARLPDLNSVDKQLSRYYLIGDEK